MGEAGEAGQIGSGVTGKAGRCEGGYTLTGLHSPGDDIIKVYGHPKMRGRGVYGHTGMALQFFGNFYFSLFPGVCGMRILEI
jgi:hypothetical protein